MTRSPSGTPKRKTMIEKFFYSMVIVFCLFVAGGLLLPRTVHVERSIEIERPVETVFAVVNRFDSYPSWSPLFERDPGTEIQLSGPGSGPGARLHWAGDPRLVGSGWQEITHSQRPSRVEIHLEMDQLGAADTWFQVDRVAGGARLTWAFDTDLVEGQGWFGGLLARYFGLFFDRWIGGDYEQGLQRLKAHVESLPETDFAGLDAEVVTVDAMNVLFISGDAQGSDTGQMLADAFREISAFMAENGVEMASQPMAITRGWDRQGFRFDAAIPVERNDIETSGNVRLGLSPTGRADRVVHRGPYESMPDSYGKLAAYMAVNGLREGSVSWEHYISDPGETAAAELITHIYFLVDENPAAVGAGHAPEN